MKIPSHSIVDCQFQADLYLQLSRMEEAGLSAQMAVDILNSTSKKISKQLTFFKKHLHAGHSITDSGYKSGLFSKLDRDLLHAGEFSGNLGQIYEQLAMFYANKALRLKQIKSKLYLPFLILILFIFITPLPALFSNSISASFYLWTSLTSLMQITLLVYLVINLIPWLTTGSLRFLGLAPLVFQLQISFPIISSCIYARQINLFMIYLGMMLSSGIVISDAVSKALDTINNPIIRKQFRPTVESIKNGTCLSESLRCVKNINEAMIQKIVVGEESGRLAETITHFAKLDGEELAAQDAMLAEWLPRIFYIFILGFVGYAILTNSSISSI